MSTKKSRFLFESGIFLGSADIKNKFSFGISILPFPIFKNIELFQNNFGSGLTYFL